MGEGTISSALSTETLISSLACKNCLDCSSVLKTLPSDRVLSGFSAPQSMRKLSWGTKGAKADKAEVEAEKKPQRRTRRTAIDDDEGGDRKTLDFGNFIIGFFPISIPPG